MVNRLDLRGKEGDSTTLLPRAEFSMVEAIPLAQAVLDDVRTRGSIALLEQAEKFDGVRPDSIRVPLEEIEQAQETLDPQVLAALNESIFRVSEAAKNQVPPFRETRFNDGAIVQQRWQAVERVGLYIPGGKAVLVSSVVMNAVTAQAAGVKSIALASPAQAEYGGLPHPTILAAAGILGITEVYAMGGAGAIGAFAYGVADLGLEPVSVIAGPGNIFGAAAKRIVSSMVGIDAEAGPTEILIIADNTADAEFIAADLLSQAEHDELAAAVLLSDSAELIDRVEQALSRQLAETPNRERAAIALSGKQSALIQMDSLAACAELSNAYAPEHLSLITQDNDALLELIQNAGAIFMGPHSPVSLGDYLAGSNHVLPTGGQARYRSGLSVATFLRPQQIIRYNQAGLAEVAKFTQDLAEAEHLPAHGNAIAVRFLQDKGQ
ncbi:MAG: histidinol dehydrogenase [Microbacteriaceae bacterium]